MTALIAVNLLAACRRKKSVCQRWAECLGWVEGRLCVLYKCQS